MNKYVEALVDVRTLLTMIWEGWGREEGANTT